jgi:hypothetical protein
MAYSDLGVLLPTESQYGNPQAYTEELRAESVKQATYLSQMDQFYTQLEESKRQFDLNYAARSKEFEWTSGFEEKKLAHQTEVDTRTLALKEKELALTEQIKQKELQFAETQLGFQKEQLALEKERLQAELEKLRTETGLAQQSMALQEKLGMSQISVSQETLALQKELGLGELSLKSQEQSFTNQLEYAQFMAGLGQAFPNGVTTGTSIDPYTGYDKLVTEPASKVYGSLVKNPNVNSYGTTTVPSSYRTYSSGYTYGM